MASTVCEAQPATLDEYLRLVPILTERVNRLCPAPENETLYRKIDPDGPDIERLADSIAANGLMEPLIVTADGYILSGHRRYAAIQRLGWEEVSVREIPIKRLDDPNRFLALLREANRQRVKTIDEAIREEVVSTTPEAAYDALLSERVKRSEASVRMMEVDTNYQLPTSQARRRRVFESS